MSDLEKDTPILRSRLVERDCIAPTFRKVVLWGCTKPNEKTFKQHIEEGNMNRDIKEFLKNNLDKLDVKDCLNYDVTFLYTLIHYACENVAHLSSKKYKNVSKDGSTLEFFLKEAKDCRNRIVHEYDAAASFDELERIRKTLETLLLKAAILYGKEEVIRDQAISELNNELHRIKNQKYNRDWVVNFIKEAICCQAISELKINRAENNAGKYVASALKMTCFDEKSSKTQKKISMQQLVHNIQSQFILVQGEPRSGKTLLMNCLVDEYLEYAHELQVHIVIYLACRASDEDNFAGLLKEKIPKTLGFLEDSSVSDAASQVSIIFLVDGFDEATENSKKLLFDLLDKSSSCPTLNWKFIISSRPHAWKKIHNECKIRKISSIFNIILQPFSSTLENKGSHFKSLLKEITKDMTRKIRDNCPSNKNPSSTASEVIELLMSQSFELYSLSEKPFLTEKQFVKLLESFNSNTKKNINFDNVLHCIFIHENGGYKFLHDGLEEYLSAKWLVLKLKDWRPSGMTSRVGRILGHWQPFRTHANPFLEIIGDSSPEVLKRFRKVLIYVVLILEEETMDSKYLSDVCHALGIAGANFDYFSDLISITKKKTAMAKALSAVVRNPSQWFPSGEKEDTFFKCWKVTNISGLNAARLFLLQKKQPHVLEVNWQRDREIPLADLEFLLKIVCERFTGDLRMTLQHSYCEFRPVDNFVQSLKGARCQMAYFQGCLSHRDAVSTLAKLAKGGDINIAINDAEGFRCLEAIEGCALKLSIRVSWNLEILNLSPLPLTCHYPSSWFFFPRHILSPGLCVAGAPEAAAAQVTNLIIKCSPSSKSFDSLYLDNCHFSDETLAQISTDLQSKEIRTANEKPPHAFKECK